MLSENDQQAAAMQQDNTDSNADAIQKAQGGRPQGLDSKLGRWNKILNQVNQLMQQAQQMGIVGRNQGQPLPQRSRSPGETGEQPGVSQEDQAAQIVQQFQQGIQMLRMELGGDKSLDQAAQYINQNEEELQSVISDQLQGGDGQ